MAVQQPSNEVTCGICHRTFALTKDSLEERSVVLEKEGLLPCVAVLTILHCPRCGKQSVVVVDSVETKDIAQQLISLHTKRMELQQKGYKIHSKLDQKYTQLERKLSFKRNQFAGEYIGSFYQTEDGKEQLDYHYHG